MSGLLHSITASTGVLVEVAKRSPLAALPVVILALIGGTYSSYQIYLFLRFLAEAYVLPGESLTLYGANKKTPGKGKWAVVTGATDGLGYEFSVQLAKAGFNVFLASRTLKKLRKVASEVEAAVPGVQTKVQAIDFSANDDEQWDALAAALEGLPIGCLVNNVGKAPELPEFFHDSDEGLIREIIEINVTATVRVTKIVMPGMMERKNGLILNVGSFAGQFPTPLLATYTGSKSFLIGWSQALAEEVRRHGIRVQLLNAWFFVSNMSKITEPSFLAPTPKDLVAKTLKTLGNNVGAVGRPFTTTPWPGHAFADWAIERVVFSKYSIFSSSYDSLLATRNRALSTK